MTNDQRRFMQDVLLTRYAHLIGSAPEMLTELVRDGFVEWEWNGGVPVYSITDAGRAALRNGIGE